MPIYRLPLLVSQTTGFVKVCIFIRTSNYVAPIHVAPSTGLGKGHIANTTNNYVTANLHLRDVYSYESNGELACSFDIPG